MSKNDGGPAFPVSTIDGFTQHGMSLRDWYAGLALQALVSRDTVQDPNNNSFAKWAVMNPLEAFSARARQAFDYADAMLKARGS